MDKTGTPRRGRSRASSIASSVDEGTPIAKRKRFLEGSSVCYTTQQANVLEEIRKERESLENFLFNDANKVSKGVMKYVLSKWSILETRLQQEIVEKEKLLAVVEDTKLRPTYAQAAAGTPVKGRVPARLPSKPKKQKGEVLIIKPKETADIRTNEELNKSLMDVLKDNRKNLKFRGIRQLRAKGVLTKFKMFQEYASKVFNKRKTYLEDLETRAT